MSGPLSEIADFLRARFGRPSPDVERVIEAFGELAGARTDEAAETVSSTVPDDLVARVDGLVTENAALRDRVAKLEEASAASDVLHRRLAALEAARPARATAPAAKPAAASA